MILRLMNDWKSSVLCAFLAVFGFVCVVEAATELADPAARYNALANERAEVTVRLRALDKRLSQAWRDPAIRSAKIDVLRARIRQLEAELVSTKSELVEAVKETPTIKQVAAERTALRKRTEALKQEMQRLAPNQAEIRVRKRKDL